MDADFIFSLNGLAVGKSLGVLLSVAIVDQSKFLMITSFKSFMGEINKDSSNGHQPSKGKQH